MKRVCSFCLGEGRVEEFTCPCCFGDGLLPKVNAKCKEIGERPRHDNVFNDTPRFAQLRKKRAKQRTSRNTVVLSLLGLSSFKRESEELEGAA